MYKKYFLMQAEPFSPLPSPRLFYKSRCHANTWKHLIYCLQRKEPVVMTAGEYGTGKTLLCLKLVRFMEKNKVSTMAFIPSPGYSFSMLLEKIARKLDISVNPGNDRECQRSIYEYFETESQEKKKPVYIIIDDINEFGYDFLSNLSKLITFNNYGYFPIKLFMFGHTSFIRNLDGKNLISFKQRIKLLPYLSPLTLSEVSEYIYFRLISSGASGNPVFDESAIKLITTASKGLPRLINKICDSSLLGAYRGKTDFIDSKMVALALAESEIRPVENISGTKCIPVQEKRKPSPERRLSVPKPQPKKIQQQKIQPETARRNEVFAESRNNKIDKNRKARKPQNIKKTPVIDGKTLVIICLVLVITLITLILFRGVRLGDRPSLEIEPGKKNSSIVEMPMPKSVCENMEDILIYKIEFEKGEEDFIHPMTEITGVEDEDENLITPSSHDEKLALHANIQAKIYKINE